MQSYANHAHRPMLWAVGLLFWLLASGGWVASMFGSPRGPALQMLGLIGVTGVGLAMGRIYVTRLQDRIILLEMQVRGARLLNPAQQALLTSLPKANVVALRFASDDELPALLDRAVTENLPPDAIKRAVTQWRADDLRT